MYIDRFGRIRLDIDARLASISQHEKELKISQEEFYKKIKAYNLIESLEQLAIISKKLFGDEYPKEWPRMGRGGVRHPSGIFLTQFAIEYLSSAIILSGSNDWKSESIKSRDNLLGLFNIYHNCLIEPISGNPEITSLLIPRYFQQIVSQAEPKDIFARQWYIFHKICSKNANCGYANLNDIFSREIGISILEYTKLCFVIYATIFSSPRFNIGKLNGAKIKGLNDVLNEKKIGVFLNFVSADYKEFREIDKKVNKDLDPIYTKTRFNPLWLKPIIKVGENDYLAPSMTAYMTSTFKGLFWWFDAHFRKSSRIDGDKFRSYFGSLFEDYAGDVIKDIYCETKVSPQISYGPKKEKKQFFDWIVRESEKIFLFEVKGYQFPLEVLQKGDSKKIRKEIVDKIIKTIIQMYKRVKDIEGFDELKCFRGKTLVPIAVFYDIPLISTSIYKANIQQVLSELERSYPGISKFLFYLMSIEELENYYYASEKVDLDEILCRVNENPHSDFRSEILKNLGRARKNLLDRAFNEYCSQIIPASDQGIGVLGKSAGF